jgi:cytochrome c biogenesis protein CcmG/thiol:disulfide interchange protein DsbE
MSRHPIGRFSGTMGLRMHRPHTAVLPGVAVVATALVIMATACTSSKGDSATCGSGPRLLPAGPTALPTMDAGGFQQLLCQLRGKPVVVNVWASWCGPCIFEAPELATAARRYNGVAQFVGVDIQDQQTPAKAFIAKYGWTYPNVFDPTGKIRDFFGLLGAPHTLFFDARGARTFVWSGPVTQEILANGIKGALAHGGASPNSASPGSSAPSPTGS